MLFLSGSALQFCTLLYEVSMNLQDSEGANTDWKTLKMHMEGASFTAAVT